MNLNENCMYVSCTIVLVTLWLETVLHNTDSIFECYSSNVSSLFSELAKTFLDAI